MMLISAGKFNCLAVYGRVKDVLCRFLKTTEGRARTDTMLPSPDFESGASTNSATPAQTGGVYQSSFISERPIS